MSFLGTGILLLHASYVTSEMSWRYNAHTVINCSLVSGHAKEIGFSVVYADRAFGYDLRYMYRQTAHNLLKTLVARYPVTFKTPFAIIKPPASS